jgi:hypothetical protein
MVTPTVGVPTITVRDLPVEGGVPRRTICIQWFGKADHCELPPEAQFLFEPQCPHDECHWYGAPEKFRVVFLGPVREWPKPEVAERVAELVTAGNLDTYVVWIVSADFPLRHETAIWAPASFMVPLVLLGDPNCGVIMPVTYAGLDVLKAENKRARSENMTLADRLWEDLTIVLPSESLPWATVFGECSRCGHLEHSYDRNPGVPFNGTVNDLIHLCLLCGRRWWQFNDYFHLWKHVTSEAEWDGLRRQAILKEAGYPLPGEDQ